MTKEIDDPSAESAAEETSRIVVQLMKEQGRGAVLLGAARLDVALEKLLKSVMAPHPGGDDNLFQPDRPLGSFSTKIALAFRLSLIEKPVEHALQMIRKVRNDYAHSFEDASLAQQEHKNRLSKPYAYARKNPLWPKLEELLATQTSISVELREYILLVAVLVGFMEACSDLQSQFVPKIPVRFSRSE